MSDPAVRFDHVTFTYPQGARPALADVDLQIAEGAFVLAVGPTGAGKSTFLRSANGLVPQFTGGHFRGRVHVAGRDTTEHPPRALADVVAFVPQDASASFVLDRVEDELAYGMENLGVAPAHMRRRVEEMLDLLDIEPLGTPQQGPHTCGGHPRGRGYWCWTNPRASLTRKVPRTSSPPCNAWSTTTGQRSWWPSTDWTAWREPSTWHWGSTAARSGWATRPR